jgi:hypothetical protein
LSKKLIFVFRILIFKILTLNNIKKNNNNNLIDGLILNFKSSISPTKKIGVVIYKKFIIISLLLDKIKNNIKRKKIETPPKHNIAFL